MPAALLGAPEGFSRGRLCFRPWTATSAWRQRLGLQVGVVNQHKRQEARLADRAGRLIDVRVDRGEHRLRVGVGFGRAPVRVRSEEQTSELQSLMRITYAVLCLKNTRRQ